MLKRNFVQVKKLQDQLAIKEKRVDELMKVEAYTKQEKITVAKQRKQARNNEVRSPCIHVSIALPCFVRLRCPHAKCTWQAKLHEMNQALTEVNKTLENDVAELQGNIRVRTIFACAPVLTQVRTCTLNDSCSRYKT